MSAEILIFRGERVVVDDTSLAIWLRLLALNLETSAPVIELRNDWLSASVQIGLWDCSLDGLDGAPDRMDIVLKTAAKVAHLLKAGERQFRGEFLSLLGFRGSSWTVGADYSTAPVLDVAEKFTRLITSHGDIISAIIQRYTCEQPRLGPPCRYCGITLWHPDGRQCLECGWDWHDPNNPIQHKTAARRQPPAIACLVDGGNPFDERGRLRRIEARDSEA